MRDLLLPYLAGRLPHDFVKQLPEALEVAYFEAHRNAEQRCAVPERVRVRGQLRHYYQNGALRDLAERFDVDAAAAHTSPKGERYTRLVFEDIVLGRTGVRFSNRTPTPAKHRKAIAALNERFEPQTVDLFDQRRLAPSDGLGVLLVTVHPGQGKDQSVPSHFAIGVPYSNLKGWHMFEPLSSLLAAYAPAQVQQPVDMAFPTLKKMLRLAEGGN